MKPTVLSPPPAPERAATSARGILFTLAAVQFTHIMDFTIMLPLGPQLSALDVRAYSFTEADEGLKGSLKGSVLPC